LDIEKDEDIFDSRSAKGGIFDFQLGRDDDDDVINQSLNTFL